MADRIKVQGFVEKLFERSGTNARGPWTAYSIKLQRVSGEVDPRYYQFGFEKPKFNEGDFVEFEAEIKDDKAAKFIDGTGRKLKNPPARPAKPAQSGGGNGGGYKGKGGGSGGYKPRPPIESKLFGKIGGNNTEDDIRRMAYSNARSAALELAALLLANDAMPMSTAKSKDGVAKRFDEIKAIVDKLTVEFYFDGASGRKLESVADAGSKETRVAPLPDAEPGKAADDSVGDAPPADPDGETQEPDAHEDFSEGEDEESF